MEKKILNFIDDFNKVKFYISGNLDPSEFLAHKNLVLKNVDGRLKISRTPNDSTFNYFTAILKEPLENACTFRIDIDSIYPNDRYVDVGIIAESKMNTCKGTLINRFNSGAISYCGYSKTTYLKGTMLAK